MKDDPLYAKWLALKDGNMSYVSIKRGGLFLREHRRQATFEEYRAIVHEKRRNMVRGVTSDEAWMRRHGMAYTAPPTPLSVEDLATGEDITDIVLFDAPKRRRASDLFTDEQLARARAQREKRKD